MGGAGVMDARGGLPWHGRAGPGRPACVAVDGAAVRWRSVDVVWQHRRPGPTGGGGAGRQLPQAPRPLCRIFVRAILRH